MQRLALMLDERELQSIWYGGRSPPWTLRALAVAYGAVVRMRRWFYAAHWLPRVRLPVPVVVVGNLTAGGTGKTPLTIAIVTALRARGFKPGVVSRGHGGSASAAMRVDSTTDPAVAGDEACMIARSNGTPLAVGRDRSAAARLLLDEEKIDVLVADDGLQHYRLCANVEICVIDGARRFGNRRLLPAGPLRESVDHYRSFDFRVCNGDGAASDEISMRLTGEEAVALSGARRRPLAEFAGRRVHAIAAIGNPARFFEQLRVAGVDVVEHAFGDHHAFVRNDIDFADDLPVLMTEKDAVKCTGFATDRHWFVPVRAVLPESFFDALAQRLRRVA